MNAAIVGATGLVGRNLLTLLLESGRYDQVHSIGRKKIDLNHAKLIQHTIELENLDELTIKSKIHHGYCTLGTTIKIAGSPDAFKRVDRDYVCGFGKLLKRLGANALAVNSSLGANATSGNLYLQTKGEMEACLTELAFQSLIIVRPALLVPTGRKEFRLGEMLGYGVLGLFGWSFVGPLRRYRAVTPAAVTQTLFDNMQSAKSGNIIIESELIVI